MVFSCAVSTQLPGHQQMDINVVSELRMRVEIATIFNTLGYYGGLYTTDFNKFESNTA
jgi:hypothetical protein